MQEIGREELINMDDEVELAQKIRQGDRRALDKLVKANLRFVISVAKQYQNQGLALADLINEGNIGLIKAAEKFDETRGFKFISYAVWWIRQSIMQALAEQSRIVRLPANQVGSQNKIKRAIQKFEQEYERMPSVEELSEQLEMPLEKVDDLLRNNGRHVSLDAPLTEGEEGTRLDVIPGEDIPVTDDGLIKESLFIELDSALKSILNERERAVITKSFGLGCTEMTLDEVAQDLNLTRERVRQIKDKALKHLRISERNKVLKTFLG